jgi:membrane protein implicated in regulation of membrane protease activity
MDAWVIWLIAAALLAAGEIATTSFYLAPFAIGAAGAAVVSLAGTGVGIALIVGAVVTGLVFQFIRPIAKRHLTQPPHTRTGADRLIGKDAIVLELITAGDAPGTVKLDGEVWTARAYEEDHSFEPGAKVQVVEIRGATAMVAD